MHSSPLTIGKLAKQAGVSLETIRYYQRKGLLQEPEKPVRGYRHYPNEAINRLRFIKRAQQVGFTLREIAELLRLDGEHCAEVNKMAVQKYQQVDQQIKDLTKLRQTLGNLVKGCLQKDSSKHCSIIDSFSR